MSIFQDIELQPVTVNETVYPLIQLIGYIRPRVTDSDDFYLLERFTINRDDVDQMTALSHAITYQTVMYYMGESTYMSSSLWTSAYDLLTEPVYYDISSQITGGIDTLVDSNADIDTYLYVYRVFCMCNGVEETSSYVVGLQDIEIRESDVPEELLPVDLNTGSGTVYRYSANGSRVVKGFAGLWFNARFMGPIEHDKDYARWATASRGLDYLDSIIDQAETIVSSMWDSLETIGIQGARLL